MTKGALYHHFSSKDGLIEAVYRETIRRHSEQVIAQSSDGDGRTRTSQVLGAGGGAGSGRVLGFGDGGHGLHQPFR